MLIYNVQKAYSPSRSLSADETVVGFRGRFSAKQCMPAKPNKYGIKAFTLADSTNRYVLNTLIYTGRDTPDTADVAYCLLPQPARIVAHLLEPYLDKGHTVVTDRYSISLPLAMTLEQHGTGFIGTAVKSQIDLPDTIKLPSFHLANDEIVAFRSNRLLALGWRAAKKRSL